MSEMKLGKVFKVSDRSYRVEKFLEEPNTGLMLLKEMNHPLGWEFIVPVTFGDLLIAAADDGPYAFCPSENHTCDNDPPTLENCRECWRWHESSEMGVMKARFDKVKKIAVHMADIARCICPLGLDRPVDRCAQMDKLGKGFNCPECVGLYADEEL